MEQKRKAEERANEVETKLQEEIRTRKEFASNSQHSNERQVFLEKQVRNKFP